MPLSEAAAEAGMSRVERPLDETIAPMRGGPFCKVGEFADEMAQLDCAIGTFPIR